MEYDAINAYDLVYCEIRQQRESGHDVGIAEQRLVTLERDDRPALLDLFDQVASSPLLPGWGTTSRSRWQTSSRRSRRVPAVPDRVQDRIHGGWLGRIAWCMLGKPVERPGAMAR